MKTCSISGCGKPHSCMGYCKSHYSTFRRHGDACYVRPGRDVDRKRMRDVWAGMIARCHKPSSVSYRYYGAKGIAVCARWRESLDAFIEDVGVIPRGLRLERIDNAIGYEPSNVRIATITEQNNHKADTRLLTHDGRTQSVAAWAADIGVTPQTLHSRLDRGWPIPVALTAPKGTEYLPNPRKTGYTSRGQKK